jgi:predicted flap endonuclease-1-like 5' DNA nuclease
VPSGRIGSAHLSARVTADSSPAGVAQLLDQIQQQRVDIETLKKLNVSQSAQLEQAKRSLARSEARIEKLTGDRESSRAQAEKTERELERKQHELEKLHGQHESLRNLVAVRAQRIRELESNLSGQRQRADALEATVAELRRDRGELEERVIELERDRDELEDKLSRLERDRDALKDKTDALQAAAAAPPPPPPQVDDLTQIKGIGPAYATKLRDLGVMLFEDLARWSDEQLEQAATQMKTSPKRLYPWRERAQRLTAERAPDTERSANPGSTLEG